MLPNFGDNGMESKMMVDGTVNRSGRFTLAMILTVFAVIASLSACDPKGKSKPVPPQGGSSAAPKKPKGLLEDWSTPQAALVFTGDIHGHLEPCGCTAGQSGGFALRGDLLRQLREEKKWPTVALDVGGSLNDARLSYPQTKYKFNAILKGLNTLGYSGIALGKEELLLGAEALFTEFTNVSAIENFHVPFLGSNTTIFGSKDLGTPTSTQFIEAGGMKIGVASIAGNSTRSVLETSGVTRDPSTLQVDDPRTILPGVIEELKKGQPDLLVLLSASSMEESQALAREFPQFHIVVTAESAEDPRVEPVYIGETLLVQVGRKGKNAAVVGVLPDGKLKSTVVSLSVDQFTDLPAMIDLMRDYQNSLKEAWPELSAQSIPDPQAGQFVGAEACKTCHSFAYSVWKESKHAHAYDSLITGRPGTEATWTSRIYDPECLACHVTGWDPQRALRYESGFIDKQKTPHLAGQQCENCHGAGSAHVAAENAWKRGTPLTPEVTAGRESIRMTLSRARTDLCVRCHDGDNSPHFDFDKYWPKVNHSGRKD
ncbi:MAG TPA: multiheme c-type cytochrome [Planctomicrobium sp.]|nr:multiheme c-type cytochrome [Planctomicrobium sp.]